MRAELPEDVRPSRSERQLTSPRRSRENAPTQKFLEAEQIVGDQQTMTATGQRHARPLGGPDPRGRPRCGTSRREAGHRRRVAVGGRLKLDRVGDSAPAAPSNYDPPSAHGTGEDGIPVFDVPRRRIAAPARLLGPGPMAVLESEQQKRRLLYALNNTSCSRLPRGRTG